MILMERGIGGRFAGDEAAMEAADLAGHGEDEVRAAPRWR